MKAPSLEKEEIETIFHYLENRVIELSKKVEFAEYERAQAVIRSIKRGEERAKALGELGMALARAQQWEQAEAVIRSIEESEEKAASSPASTAVQTQLDSRPIYVVIASVSKTVNIRSDHSARSTIIEKLQPGDRVFLQDRRIRNDDPPHATTWQKVTTMNGATGWIDFDYLAPSKDVNQSSTTAVAESPASAPATEDTEVGRLFAKWLSASNAGDTEQEASLYAEPALRPT